MCFLMPLAAERTDWLHHQEEKQGTFADPFLSAIGLNPLGPRKQASTSESFTITLMSGSFYKRH